MAVGKRIFLKRNLPDPEVVKGFSKIPASNTADCMERNCAMNPRVKLMSNPDHEMVGPAFTVHTRAGDNLAIYAALRYCQEGDVIVIDDEGDNTRSLIGEIAGIVIDGPIRDIDNLQTWNLPIYARSTTPGGPYKEGPGELNVPVSCGNVSVNPGDIILGDSDGVICIPRKDAPDILPKAQEFHKKDNEKAIAFSRGEVDLSWVDETLEEKNFEIIDDVYRP